MDYGATFKRIREDKGIKIVWGMPRLSLRRRVLYPAELRRHINIHKVY